MIYLISGDNDVQINNFILGRKKDYNDLNIYDLSQDAEPKDLKEYLNTDSLFSQKKLVIINPKNATWLNYGQDDIKEISDSNLLELLINSKNLQKNSKIYQLFKKNSKLINLEKPADYTNFNISDAFFIDKSPQKVLNELNKIDDLEEEIMPLVATFYNGIRNYVSYKYKNESWDSIHPYVKKKTSSYPNIEADRILNIYEQILNMDVKNKSTSKSAKALLMDFVLYFS